MVFIFNSKRFIRRYVKKHVKDLVTLFLIAILLTQINYIINEPEVEAKEQSTSSELNDTCKSIDIEIDDFENLVQLANGKKHPTCPIEDWVIIDKDGKVHYNIEYANKNKIKITRCYIRALKWENDFKFHLEKPKLIKNGDYLNKKDEFFKISCTSKKPHKWYHGLHARIFQKKENERWIDNQILNEIKNAFMIERPTPINVIFFGLDSVSREKWLNSLPVSSKYLTKTMGANILKGYNIVGDGTPAALIPILTGFHEEELPNTLKGTPNASFCDEVYPFVWKEFEEKLNYATMYNEDWPQVGMYLINILNYD